MAKCGLCSTRKGKRFCAPLDKIICPVCCAENRGIKIDCNPDCRYLEGVAFQNKKEEERKFAQLMGEVGHGQFDDIFRDEAVAKMAYDIESLVRALYQESGFDLTDPQVREAYKAMYKFHSEQEQIDSAQLNMLNRALLDQYKNRHSDWEKGLDNVMIGQVYLRLMISVNKMSGGMLGNKSYLNYLKNNLGSNAQGGELVVEDRFGNKISRDMPGDG
jgi:hypothetical protein